MTKNTENSETVKCDYCDEEFESIGDTRFHVFDIHQSSAVTSVFGVDCIMHLDTEKKYTCVACKKKYKGFHNFSRHFKAQHPEYDLENNKRKKTEFSFEDGCSDVLNNKKIKADSMADALSLSPIRTTTNDQNIEYSFFTLVNKSTMETLNQLGVLEKPLTSEIQPHVNKPKPEMTPEIYIDKLNFQNFPLFQNVMGSYCTITKEIETDLNKFDCNLVKVVNLFTGALLFINKVVVLSTTVEIYDRDFTLDVHAENSSASFPEKNSRASRFYELLKVIIIEEKQGKQSMKKLIIGTTKFNLLITCSLLLSGNDRFVSVGPTCPEALHFSNTSFTQILLCESNVKEFYEEETAVTQNDVTKCRQLMSVFSHKSTYLPYRSSILSNPVMMPATVFTLCNFPSGYGMSSENSARFVSVLFKTIGQWIINRQTISLKNIEKLKELVTQHSDIFEIVIKLEEAFKKNGEIDIFQFLNSQKGLSTLCQSIASNISTANKVIEKDLMNYFATTFGKI